MANPGSNRPLRVLLVASGDSWAGAEAQVLTLASGLHARDDVTVRVAVLNERELAARLRVRGIATDCFDETHMATPAIAVALHRLAREFTPDIVHTHRQKENVLGGAVAGLLGIPSLRTVHGLEEHAPALTALRRRLARAVDRTVARLWQRQFISVSDDLTPRLVREFPFARIDTIVNGIDVDAVRAAATAATAPPTFDDAHVHIATIGRLVEIKRIDRAIALASHLATTAPGRYRLHVVGDGPLGDTLRASAADATRDGADIVFHGFASNPLPLLARADALLFTSDYEGMPMTALESLAVGTPIVARDIGGLRVLHDAGAEVAIAMHDDVAGLAAALEHALTFTHFGGLPERFTAEHCCTATLALYRRCIAERRSR